MKVLALEPWYGGSHRNFVDGLIKNSCHEYELVTMAARFWKWRLQGGAQTLARKCSQLAESGFTPDVILASSMVNIPAFLALSRKYIGNVPVVYYLHENQLTYPLSKEEKRDLSYAYINYLSCLAADQVVFNSEFHYNEFIRALPGLLRVFPDYTHLHTVSEIRAKSRVMHLGMNLQAHARYSNTQGSDRDSPIVLWNQRWEYDKNPEAFFRLMNRLDDAGCRFRLILAGKRFEEQPSEFDTAFERYADRILHYGYAEDFEEYSRLLHRADIVVSTAIHEFFGIAMLEAIYCGCHPLLPNRLSYPELIPEKLHKPLLHAPILYDDDESLFTILKAMLMGEERPLPHGTLRGIVEHLDWSVHVEQYDALMASLPQDPS
ncbi:MAG: DUF3524 domain-containing protein [Bacteroidetes bacterium]|nr:DUF3524 domain-containing protein [Bacteroidota bacterium]MXW82096.1 DUF3524 domain-containing protein [Rhodothermaceae bacterium]MDE2671938.1 DUF3524 domain-containing protein [Bacteroidota bacterium]MXX58801.1 DUF3524 domain-containing protein [Rhodothermaceae bacterium]MYD18849.1 DUF3524 domain-containing protein [Rhodothermaceae bacterium]